MGRIPSLRDVAECVFDSDSVADDVELPEGPERRC